MTDDDFLLMSHFDKRITEYDRVASSQMLAVSPLHFPGPVMTALPTDHMAATFISLQYNGELAWSCRAGESNANTHEEDMIEDSR